MLTGGVGSMAKKFKSNKDEKTSKVNKKNPYFTSIPSSGMRNVSVNDTLSDAIAKLYSLVKRQNEYDIKKNELEEDFDGQKSMDEEKKHQELIDAFKKLQKKSVKKERVKREPEKKPKETPVDKKVPEAKPAPKESVPKKTSEPVKETPKTPKETPKKSSEPVQQPAPKQPPPKTETPVPKPSAQPVKPPSSGSTVGTMAKAAGTTAIVGGLLMPSQSIGAVIDKAAKTVGVDRGLMYAMLIKRVILIQLQNLEHLLLKEYINL
jgi:hypothetical protein